MPVRACLAAIARLGFVDLCGGYQNRLMSRRGVAPQERVFRAATRRATDCMGNDPGGDDHDDPKVSDYIVAPIKPFWRQVSRHGKVDIADYL